VQERERHHNTREELLERQQAAINDLIAASQKILSDAKELYATAEAWANTTIKQEEELAVHIRAVAKWVQVVEELEQRLQEREGLDDIKLGREFEALATRDSSLDSHEATLEVGQKALEDACHTITAHELAADIRETNLDFRVAELVKKENRLAEKRASCCSEETGGAPRVLGWQGTDGQGLPRPDQGRSRLPVQEVDAMLPLLDSAGTKMSQLEEVICD
jgi:hypothetical protein